MLRTNDTGAISVCDHMSTLLLNIHSSLIMSYVYTPYSLDTERRAVSLMLKVFTGRRRQPGREEAD